MRLAFRRRDPGDWSAFRPLLLDQAGAAALTRLAAERATPETAAERSPRVQKARGPSLFTRARRLLLPLVMLAFGGLVTAGLVFGAWLSATDGDGLSRGDALRLTVIALLSLLFLGQLLATMRMLPGTGWLLSRFERPLPPPPPLPLLDQVTATVLTRTAPDGLGTLSRAGLLRSRGRRLADISSWVVLVVLALGVTLFFAAGAALGTWSAFWQEGFGFAAAVQVAFLLLAGFGVFMLALMGLRGLRQRRQRRRKRLLRRLLRFLLRLFDSGRRWAGDAAGFAGSGAAAGYLRHGTAPWSRLSRLSGAAFGRALLLTAAVAGLAFYPAFAGDGDGGGVSGGSSELSLTGNTGPGSPAGLGSGGPPIAVVSPAPPSPTPETEDEDDQDEDAGGGAGGPDSLADPSSVDPTATFTPTLPPSPTATLTPTATPTPVPCVADVSEDELDFDDDVTSLALTLTLNDCAEPLNFVAGGSESWISVNPGGGVLPPGGSQDLTVLVDRGGLAPDEYEEEVQVVTSLGTLVIPVLMEVEPPPCEIDVSPTALDFGVVLAPDTEEFEISLTDCGESVDFTVSDSAGWLFPSPRIGTLSPGGEVDIEVNVDPGPMVPGPQSAEVLVSTDELGTFSVTVTACKQVRGGPPCP